MGGANIFWRAGGSPAISCHADEGHLSRGPHKGPCSPCCHAHGCLGQEGRGGSISPPKTLQEDTVDAQAGGGVGGLA